MTEWLQAKRGLLPCTPVIANTCYIISHQNSPRPAGLYLSNKSMSFILIQSHLVLILQYIDVAQFCSRGVAHNKNP